MNNPFRPDRMHASGSQWRAAARTPRAARQGRRPTPAFEILRCCPNKPVRQTYDYVLKMRTSHARAPASPGLTGDHADAETPVTCSRRSTSHLTLGLLVRAVTRGGSAKASQARLDQLLDPSPGGYERRGGSRSCHRAGETILVHGDYDMTLSQRAMFSVCCGIWAPRRAVVPHRMHDGSI